MAQRPVTRPVSGACRKAHLEFWAQGDRRGLGTEQSPVAAVGADPPDATMRRVEGELVSAGKWRRVRRCTPEECLALAWQPNMAAVICRVRFRAISASSRRSSLLRSLAAGAGDRSAAGRPGVSGSARCSASQANQREVRRNHYPAVFVAAESVQGANNNPRRPPAERSSV